jgi:phage shock protein B
MFDEIIPLAAILSIFVGMPWLILHYVTKWKQARGISPEDEKLLDDMFETARRLEERVATIERIMTADNPRWREEAPIGPASTSAEPAARRH